MESVSPSESASAAAGVPGLPVHPVYSPELFLSLSPGKKLSELVSMVGKDGFTPFDVVNAMDKWTETYKDCMQSLVRAGSSAHGFARVGTAASVGSGQSSAAPASVAGAGAGSFVGSARSVRSVGSGSRVQAIRAKGSWRSGRPSVAMPSWRPRSPVPDGLCYLKAFAEGSGQIAGCALGEWPKFKEVLERSWREFEPFGVLSRFSLRPEGEGRYHLATASGAGPAFLDSLGSAAAGGSFSPGTFGAVLAAAYPPVGCGCGDFDSLGCDCPVPEGVSLDDRVGGLKARGLGDGDGVLRCETEGVERVTPRFYLAAGAKVDGHEVVLRRSGSGLVFSPERLGRVHTGSRFRFRWTGPDSVAVDLPGSAVLIIPGASEFSRVGDRVVLQSGAVGELRWDGPATGEPLVCTNVESVEVRVEDRDMHGGEIHFVEGVTGPLCVRNGYAVAPSLGTVVVAVGGVECMSGEEEENHDPAGYYAVPPSGGGSYYNVTGEGVLCFMPEGARLLGVFGLADGKLCRGGRYVYVPPRKGFSWSETSGGLVVITNSRFRAAV